MKKIINNKLYNTDTAESLGQKEWGEPTDFYYIFESLYRTSKGNFFLYRKVGAGSEFAKPIGNNSWVPREDIEAFGEKELECSQDVSCLLRKKPDARKRSKSTANILMEV